MSSEICCDVLPNEQLCGRPLGLGGPVEVDARGDALLQLDLEGEEGAAGHVVGPRLAAEAELQRRLPRRALVLRGLVLVERFDIEPFPDFSAK